MYGRFFPNMVFCGPALPDPTKFPDLYTDNQLNRPFITFHNKEGYPNGTLSYVCAAKALQLDYNITGTLLFADDLLLNVNNIAHLNKSKIWIANELNQHKASFDGNKMTKTGWYWWKRFLLPSMGIINGRLSNHPITPTEKRCYDTLYDTYHVKLTIFAGFSDLLYIPRRFASDFAELFTLFSEYDMWLEVAVPTVVQCLSGKHDWERLKSRHVHNLSFIPKRYNMTLMKSKHFDHPVKWSYLDGKHSKSQGYTPLFCIKILPFLYNQNANNTRIWKWKKYRLYKDFFKLGNVILKRFMQSNRQCWNVPWLI